MNRFNLVSSSGSSAQIMVVLYCWLNDDFYLCDKALTNTKYLLAKINQLNVSIIRLINSSVILKCNGGVLFISERNRGVLLESPPPYKNAAAVSCYKVFTMEHNHVPLPAVAGIAGEFSTLVGRNALFSSSRNM